MDRIWTHARLLTMAGQDLGVVHDGIVIGRADRIAYAGPRAEAPAWQGEVIDCAGRWITPGLVDCHTHLVHGGHRAGEFARRLEGVSYAQIAAEGGGIVSTMRATRAASEDELVTAALGRLDALLREGVTTVEVKSGYGLEREAELRMLRAARRLGRARPVGILTTFLGAHAVPPEYAGDADGYVDHLCDDILPAVVAAGLADAVDVFCENIAFSADQSARVFAQARRCGLPIKVHAEQLSNSGAAALAADFGALSADHLEHLDAAGIAAMQRAGTTAVLLPGAYYATRETQLPPIQLLRNAGIPMAIATDCNPGTSPLTSLLLAMNMGATLFRLTVAECLAGVTREAARALGRLDRIGTLEAGKQCDLAIWDIDDPAELVYRIGFNPLHSRVWSGQ